jgi:lactoylglutathione lyase
MANSTPNPGDYFVAPTLTRLPDSTAADYRLNHSMLRISNPARSLGFYSDLFGMSLIFSFNTGPFTIYYMAYPGADDTVPRDILVTSGSRAGLLELFHVHGTENDKLVNGNEEGSFGFGHLGFTVPDVVEALKRAEGAGYNVIKWPGDVRVSTLGLPEGVQEGTLHMKFVNMYNQVGFVKDPDG